MNAKSAPSKSPDAAPVCESQDEIPTHAGLSVCALVTEADLDTIFQDCAAPRERETAKKLLRHAFQLFVPEEETRSPDEFIQSVMAKAGINPVQMAPGVVAESIAQLGKRCICCRCYQRAVEHFNAATILYPPEARYYCYVGQAWYCMMIENKTTEEDIPEGIRLPLQRAIEIDPDYDEPHLLLGYISKHNGEYERALTEFGEALERNPNNSAARTEANDLLARFRDSNA